MNILVAGAMRSGSTSYVNDLVSKGFKRANIVRVLAGYENEEQLVDEKALAFLTPMDGLVFQTHMRAFGRNVPLLKEYGIVVRVLYRGIMDSLWSWRCVTDSDMMEGRQPFASIHIPKEWNTWDEWTRNWWTIYNVTPWYIGFYKSWEQADYENITFWKYEQYFSSPKIGGGNNFDSDMRMMVNIMLANSSLGNLR